LSGHTKDDVRKALEIERAVSQELGELMQSPDPEWPGNPPAGAYQHSLARVAALEKVLAAAPE